MVPPILNTLEPEKSTYQFFVLGINFPKHCISVTYTIFLESISRKLHYMYSFVIQKITWKTCRPQRGGTNLGVFVSYMAGHEDAGVMTGHIGTNTPKFVPPCWGWPPVDPTQTELCKFGWVWSSLRRVQFFKTPSPMSFLVLTELWGENSVSSSQPTVCVPKQTHRVFRRTDRVRCRNSVSFSLPKQYSRNSIPPVS